MHMVYVALLRGINVGGKNKVEMIRLKNCFEKAGMKNVRTYINSGNVIFESGRKDQQKLSEELEKNVESEFGFNIKVLLRNVNNIEKVVKALPDIWVNDQTMKCDVMFLWERVDNPNILNTLSIKPNIEDVKYVNGAILWRVDRQYVTRSGMMKLVGTDLYKQMTIRNCNTARKLYILMKKN